MSEFVIHCSRSSLVLPNRESFPKSHESLFPREFLPQKYLFLRTFKPSLLVYIFNRILKKRIQTVQNKSRNSLAKYHGWQSFLKCELFLTHSWRIPCEILITSPSDPFRLVVLHESNARVSPIRAEPENVSVVAVPSKQNVWNFVVNIVLLVSSWHYPCGW